MCEILSEVNHFAAEKGKISICGVFIKAAMILLFVYAGFHLIYLQMIFYSSLIVLFHKCSSTRCKSDVIQLGENAKEMQFKPIMGDLK